MTGSQFNFNPEGFCFIEDDSNSIYEPSPEKIRRETAKLRKTWSEQTHRLRGGCSEQPQWRPPVVSVRLDAEDANA